MRRQTAHLRGCKQIPTLMSRRCNFQSGSMMLFGSPLEHHIEDVRYVSQRAVFTLQTVAQEMGRTDMPAPDEVESLLRDMPRFELASLPEAINMSHWMFLGS